MKRIVFPLFAAGMRRADRHRRMFRRARHPHAGARCATNLRRLVPCAVPPLVVLQLRRREVCDGPSPTRATNASSRRRRSRKWRSCDPAATDGDEKRALAFLRDYLVSEYVMLQTAHYWDEISDTETSGKVTLPGVEEEVAYRDLDILLDNEPDSERREMLQGVAGEILAGKTEPDPREANRGRARALRGARISLLRSSFPSSSAIIDLAAFIALSGAFIDKTDEQYREMFANQVRWVLGIEPEEFRRSDIGRLSQVSEFNRFLSERTRDPVVPRLPREHRPRHDERRGNADHDQRRQPPEEGPPRGVLRHQRPRRRPCLGQTVGGRAPTTRRSFTKGDTRFHFANATTPVWEFQQLGNNTVTEAYSGLFEGLWGDPDWLKSYREYVRDYNRFVGGSERVPLMTDRDIARLVENRAFWDLYFVRRYAGAKLVYETVLHGGDPAIYGRADTTGRRATTCTKPTACSSPTPTGSR